MMDRKMRNKVVIIGIDSATFDVINPMIKEGKLPNLSRMIQEGTSGPLRSTVPPVTPPAWVSFMTGKNPGKHGVFDFYVPPFYGYVRPVLNARYIKTKTIWRILSDQGLKVGVVNLPMTHPPEEINGFIIPGMQYSFDEGGNLSHPPELMQEIKKQVGDYRILYGDLECLYTDNMDKLLNAWRDIFEVRKKAILYLMENKEWDLFMPVFYSIDVMQHHFWRFYDRTHPLYDRDLAAKYGNVISEFYEKVDSAIGDILKRVDEDATVVVVSDHGAGPEEQGFSINNWLHKEGFLSFKQPLSPLRRFRFPHLFYKVLRRSGFPGVAWTVPLDQLRALGRAIDPREGLNVPYFINWRKTMAYGGNHTEQGIYINLKGREPLGAVEKGREYNEVRDAIIERLKEVIDPDTGRPLEVKVSKKEDVYHGSYMDGAPDIFLEIKGGRCLMQKEIYNKELFFRACKSSGTHRMDGILLLKGNGIKAGHSLKGANITDLAPTILYAMGMAVPEDMDGKILVDAFERYYIEENPARYSSSKELEVKSGEGVLDEEESDKVREALRSLGYFG